MEIVRVAGFAMTAAFAAAVIRRMRPEAGMGLALAAASCSCSWLEPGATVANAHAPAVLIKHNYAASCAHAV